MTTLPIMDAPASSQAREKNFRQRTIFALPLLLGFVFLLAMGATTSRHEVSLFDRRLKSGTTPVKPPVKPPVGTGLPAGCNSQACVDSCSDVTCSNEQESKDCGCNTFQTSLPAGCNSQACVDSCSDKTCSTELESKDCGCNTFQTFSAACAENCDAANCVDEEQADYCGCFDEVAGAGTCHSVDCAEGCDDLTCPFKRHAEDCGCFDCKNSTCHDNCNVESCENDYYQAKNCGCFECANTECAKNCASCTDQTEAFKCGCIQADCISLECADGCNTDACTWEVNAVNCNCTAYNGGTVNPTFDVWTRN
jgi:hypothetical protein